MSQAYECSTPYTFRLLPHAYCTMNRKPLTTPPSIQPAAVEDRHLDIAKLHKLSYRHHPVEAHRTMPHTAHGRKVLEEKYRKHQAALHPALTIRRFGVGALNQPSTGRYPFLKARISFPSPLRWRASVTRHDGGKVGGNFIRRVGQTSDDRRCEAFACALIRLEVHV